MKELVSFVTVTNNREACLKSGISMDQPNCKNQISIRLLGLVSNLMYQFNELYTNVVNERKSKVMYFYR